MINRPWISYSLQQDSKDGEEGIVKLLQVREELTALLPRVTQRRSMAFEKFKELCIDIGFSIFVAFSSRTRSVIVNRISVSSQCRAISPVDGRGGGKKYPGVSIS